MLRPYSYSFGSLPKNAASPSSSGKGTPGHHHQPPPFQEVSCFLTYVCFSQASPEKIAGSRLALQSFREVEFECNHFDWSKNSIFKYVLIEVSSLLVPDVRQLVRGMTSAEFHADSAEPALRQIDKAGLCHRVIGGGRIRYVAKTQTLTVYGYSQGFPWPEGKYMNELAAQIIHRNFPNLVVDWSNEGY